MRPMSDLEQAWRSWRALSRRDRSKFLTMLRTAYGREREAVIRQHAGGTIGERVTRLADLTLTETDLERLGP
jgi:hypothetical protein